MTERGILFSAPMVRALLAGTKTQTRRLVVPKPPPVEVIRARCGTDFSLYLHPGHDRWTVGGPVQTVREAMETEPSWRCPYGVPGDRLWVRETWGGCARCGDRCYRATPRVCMPDDDDLSCEPTTWRPSIFLPRYASRITLEVTAVRVERLQDITPADALAEGITIPVGEISNRLLIPITDDGFMQAIDRDRLREQKVTSGEICRAHYASLWDSINRKRAPWSSNPWVWCVTFKRVEGT